MLLSLVRKESNLSLQGTNPGVHHYTTSPIGGEDKPVSSGSLLYSVVNVHPEHVIRIGKRAALLQELTDSIRLRVMSQQFRVGPEDPSQSCTPPKGSMGEHVSSQGVYVADNP